MFELLKWYLDVVTSDGAVVILYAARLRWARLVVHYASLLVDEPSGRRSEQATTRRIEAPRTCDGDVLWQNGPLDVQGRWRAGAPIIRQSLLSSGADRVEWSCRVPRGRATVRHGRAVYDGTGYAESLHMTLPPWRMPIHTLHWGRYTSDSHSLVWIDWEGSEHRSWTWLDGSAQPGATLVASGLAGLECQRELHFAAGRQIRDRRVLGALGSTMPAALRRAAGPLAGMHEHKHVSRSSIMHRGHPVDTGWALHEMVTW